MDPKTIKAEQLTVDPPVVITCHKPVYNQKWALASFVSPDDRIKQRFLFEANRFLYHDVNRQIMDTTSNLVKDLNTAFVKSIEKKIATYSSGDDPIYKAAASLLEEARDELCLNEDEQVEKTLRLYRIDHEELTDRFDTYKSQNDKELELDFCKSFGEQTSVRGFKVRGGFEELADAQAWAKKMHDEVEPFIHTFAFPMGHWVPYDPNPDSVKDQEYMVPQLNELMEQKKKNAEQRDEFFAKRKQMMMDEAEKSKDTVLREKLEQRIKERKASRTSLQ